MRVREQKRVGKMQRTHQNTSLYRHRHMLHVIDSGTMNDARIRFEHHRLLNTRKNIFAVRKPRKNNILAHYAVKSAEGSETYKESESLRLWDNGG